VDHDAHIVALYIIPLHIIPSHLPQRVYAHLFGGEGVEDFVDDLKRKGKRV